MHKLLFSILLACAVSGTLTAQTTVVRTSVLEEFSTALCQYCPNGYQIIKKAIDSHPGTLWIVHHAGFMTDDITIAASERLTFLYASTAFAPAYMVDRTIPEETYHDYSPVWGVDDSARVAGHLDEMAAKPCFTTVEISGVNYDAATHAVSATVSGRIMHQFDTAITRLSLYLVEDSIVMPQASTTGTINDYIHMHAVRGSATDVFGVPLTFAPDGSYSYTINYTLPSVAVASHCRLVALIHYFKSNNLTKNNVLNAAATEGYLCNHTAGIDEDPNLGSQFTVSPNPASSRVIVNADRPIRCITVIDTYGRCQLRDTQCGSPVYSINCSSWPAGIYLIRLTTEQGTTTRKMIVNK